MNRRWTYNQDSIILNGKIKIKYLSKIMFYIAARFTWLANESDPREKRLTMAVVVGRNKSCITKQAND